MRNPESKLETLRGSLDCQAERIAYPLNNERHVRPLRLLLKQDEIQRRFR